MTYADRYEFWVQTAERWAKRKSDRERQLTELAARRVTLMPKKTMGGDVITADFVADGLIAEDTLVREYELHRERAVATATMYGLGMLAESLNRR